MMRPPTDIALTVNPIYRSSNDTYNISNLFMGLIYHKTINPELGLYHQYPFMSIYSTITQLKSNSITH